MPNLGSSNPPGPLTYDACYYDAVAVTAGTSFPVCRALYVPTAGAMDITLASGAVITFGSGPIGIFPLAATNISAGTGVVALY